MTPLRGSILHAETHAKAKGVKLGRRPKLTEHQRKEAIRRRDKGDESLAEIGRSYTYWRESANQFKIPGHAAHSRAVIR